MASLNDLLLHITPIIIIFHTNHIMGYNANADANPRVECSIQNLFLIIFVLTSYCLISTKVIEHIPQCIHEFTDMSNENIEILMSVIRAKKPQTLHDTLLILETDAENHDFLKTFVLLANLQTKMQSKPNIDHVFNLQLFDRDKAIKYLTALNVLYTPVTSVTPPPPTPIKTNGGGQHRQTKNKNTDIGKISNPITGKLIDSHGKTARTLINEFKLGKIKLSRQFVTTVKRALASHEL